MRLASFLLFLALPQAQAGPDNAGACAEGREKVFVVESGCTKESKTCKALFKKEDLPKGKACGTPVKGLEWNVPREPFFKACQKESAALAEKANNGELNGLCQEMVSPFPDGNHR